MGLTEKDRQYIWHPYTQMLDAPAHIPIVKGEGAWLITESGERILDAISSWWVTAHGHSHPYIAQKVSEQLNTLEHVIFAGFTHPKAVELAERLLPLLPNNQAKLFYSDNGSTAVEVAIKMAIQYWHNQGIEKSKIVAIEGAYHGDTFGAMSVSGRSAFNNVFSKMLFEVEYTSFPKEEDSIEELKNILKQGDCCAFIFEPLIQGAAGMRMYPANALDELVGVCKEHNVLTIADEVMTGFGRTGKMFASEYLSHQPDIMCFSKCITGGTMALGATTCSEEIYEAFLSEDKMKTFFHGHSFTANPIACAAACASLDVFENENTLEKISAISRLHKEFLNEMEHHNSVENIQLLGTILAIELKTGDETSYFNSIRDKAYNYFMSKNILLRPLGNVIYILPPYCITEGELRLVYSTIKSFLNEELSI